MLRGSARRSLQSSASSATPNSDFSFTNSIVSFYKLGSPTRTRLELQSAFRYEFYKDVYWSVNGFESFDSRPPEGEKGNDAGINIALGWSF